MYGNDLDVGTYSSAFPKPEDEFGRHPWNLNQVKIIELDAAANLMSRFCFCFKLFLLSANAQSPPHNIYAAAARDWLALAQHDI